MGTEELIGLVFLFVFLLLVTIILIVLVTFIRRKNALITEKEKEKQLFERTLAEAQVEIREETLRNVSWELHDNIGQIMTLAKVRAQNAGDDPQKMKQAAKLIGEGLTELRALSRIINTDAIKKLSLKEALQIEIDRFNRLRFIEASLRVEGHRYTIEDKAQTIIFRIFQEFFSNTIKHAQATTLDVHLIYTEDSISVKAKDNGIGFVNDETTTGIGIKNMKTRAALIDAQLDMISNNGEGTQLTLNYKTK